MAFTCSIAKNSKGLSMPTAHVVIGSFQELEKDSIVINTLIYGSKSEYLAGYLPVESRRDVFKVLDLTFVTTIRAAIYDKLVTDPYYENVVADTEDDFPVTPTE